MVRAVARAPSARVEQTLLRSPGIEALRYSVEDIQKAFKRILFLIDVFFHYWLPTPDYWQLRMTDLELQQLRRAQWRTDGAHPVRTLEDAQSFISETGLCLMYPIKPPVLCATFVGAYSGSDVNLPTWQSGLTDPRSLEATALMVRLLRSKAAYEANSFGESGFLISADAFPYFYALVGDRNPKGDPHKLPAGKWTPLAADLFALIQKHGPITKGQMREGLGGAPSEVALDRALNQLWSELKITRVDYKTGEGAYWDALYRWSPEAVKEGVQLSVLEALTALISKYVEGVVAAEETEIVEFFAHFAARAKSRDAIHALLAAREFDLVSSSKRPLIQLTPEKVPYVQQPYVLRPPREPRPPRPPTRPAGRPSRRPNAGKRS